jgi:hypothetical protein
MDEDARMPRNRAMVAETIIFHATPLWERGGLVLAGIVCF